MSECHLSFISVTVNFLNCIKFETLFDRKLLKFFITELKFKSIILKVTGSFQYFSNYFKNRPLQIEKVRFVKKLSKKAKKKIECQKNQQQRQRLTVHLKELKTKGKIHSMIEKACKHAGTIHLRSKTRAIDQTGRGELVA